MKLQPLFVCMAIALSGCASINNPGQRIPPLAPASAPKDNVGDTYVFSDGFVHQVLAVRGDQVTWALGPAGILARRSQDFFTPPQQWEHEGIQYSFEETHRDGDIWPLKEGRKLIVSGRLTVDQPSGKQSFDQTWTCTVPQSERVQLATGRFDTFVVDCSRTSDTGAHWQRRRFNYAPSLGHAVRTIEEMRAWGYPGYVFKQRDLTNFYTQVSKSYLDAFHQALSSTPSGQVFVHPEKGEDFYIELRSTYTTGKDRTCREVRVFEQKQAKHTAHYCFTQGWWSLASIKTTP
jgi:hypothetical protein